MRHTVEASYLEYRLDSVRFSSKQGTFSATNLGLIPSLPKSQYAHRAKDHADWTRIRGGSIECFGIDFPLVTYDNRVVVDSIVLRNVDIESYKNRKIAAPEKEKYMLYESLQRIPVGIFVRRVSLSNVNPVYEELAANGETPGRVSFQGIDGEFYDLSNSRELSGNPYMKLVATGRLMNRGVLDVTVVMPTDPSNDRFEVAGTLRNMPLAALNPMILPLGDVEVKSGQLNVMEFHVTGWRIHSETQMRMLYSDLEIMLMKEKNDRLKERKFLSWLANTIVIKDANPDKHGVRTAQEPFTRDFHRSQFNYLWKSLFVCIKETVGVPDF